jgi:hypothetical protein
MITYCIAFNGSRKSWVITEEDSCKIVYTAKSLEDAREKIKEIREASNEQK